MSFALMSLCWLMKVWLLMVIAMAALVGCGERTAYERDATGAGGAGPGFDGTGTGPAGTNVNVPQEQQQQQPANP